MGITIIRKSDPNHPKPNPKIALVLAGGGVSGGAFKLGGLLALNNFMVNQKSTGFDIYVGTSAGAIISSYMANGISVKRIMRSLAGNRFSGDFMTPMDPEAREQRLSPIRASEFYSLNYEAFLSQPLRLAGDLLSLIPRHLYAFFRANNLLKKPFRNLVSDYLRRPTYENLERLARHCLDYAANAPKRPSMPWGYLPTGIFTTDRFERSTRRNLERNGISNDFKALYEKTGKSLYIMATDLSRAERVVFGHDAESAAPISRAVQASIAIPLFYSPVTIDGVDYVDGAVAKTTSIDWAVDKGADLIICYNPFRPFNHESYCRKCDPNSRLRPAQDGLYAVLNQVMRAVLHTRLQSGLRLREMNPDFKGDILLIEPSEYDDTFFDMNPLAFRERRLAVRRGYESVRESIAESYSTIREILNAYGIDTSPRFIRACGPPQKVDVMEGFYEKMLV